jgi:hypothetical protein
MREEVKIRIDSQSRLYSFDALTGSVMSTIFGASVTGLVIATLFWTWGVAAADAQGTQPGDDTMTCGQIAMELQPYAQQLVPNIQALGATQQQLYQQAQQMGEKRRAEETLLTPLASAGAVDPTGAAKRAYQLALMAQMAKERGENEAFANSPLIQQNKAQSQQLVEQGMHMQSNARLQRLLQLAQAKHCDKS